jgi:hypothetical protein
MKDLEKENEKLKKLVLILATLIPITLVIGVICGNLLCESMVT